MMNYSLFILANIFLLESFISTTNADCPFPNEILRNGRFVYQNSLDSSLTVAPENYLLRFRCRRYYTLVGPEEIKCSSYKWSDIVPKCIKMSCSDPPSIPNGSHRILRERVGNRHAGCSIAVYSCDENYQLKDPNDYFLTCTLSLEEGIAMWQGQVPSCKHRNQCGSGHEMLGNMTGEVALIGGRQMAEPWPWMASIYKLSNISPPDQICGASIIHEKFILTGATCVCKNRKEFVAEKDVLIKIGLTNTKNETNMEEFEVEKIFVHPKHECHSDYDYDIALLQLKIPIQFNEIKSPICLPPIELLQGSKLYKPGQIAVVTGWGQASMDERFQIEQHLRDVILPIQSSETCNQSLQNQRILTPLPRAVFTERMLCAGDGTAQYDACMGYGGSPLMQSQLSPEGNNFWTQIGIVSWGIGCGKPNTFGFYTHVQNLASWIASIIDREK